MKMRISLLTGFLTFAFAQPIIAAEHTTGKKPKQGVESRDFVRDSVGDEGEQPGSALRETTKKYRRKRQADSSRNVSRLPKSAGISEPRLDIGDKPETEAEKKRTDRTKHRINKEVDPGVP